MDRSISTAVKNKLFGTTWKSDIANLVNFKDNFSRVKNIELYLPYATYKKNSDSNLEFIYVNKENYDNIIKSEPYAVYYMILFLREGFNKQTLGIELTANAEVVPQYYNRKRWYYYEWNKHELTIRRILGTVDKGIIEKMVKELMEEYKRFYLMYCKTNWIGGHWVMSLLVINLGKVAADIAIKVAITIATAYLTEKVMKKMNN